MTRPDSNEKKAGNLTLLRKLSGSMFYGVGAFIYYDLIPVSEFKPINYIMSAALGGASLCYFGDAMKLSEGISDMERPEGPMRPPRLDYDVNTGLPNHSACEDRRELLLAQGQEEVAIVLYPRTIDI